MAKTAYQKWMEQEDIPIVTGYGVEDVRELERKNWPRTGQKGGFVHLIGQEGLAGMYVGEILPGESTLPQKHLYQQLIYILEGQGKIEVWRSEDQRVESKWGKGSLFVSPLNCWYRLENTSSEPVIYLGVTDASILMDLIHNDQFIFNNRFDFSDRFLPDSDYFNIGKRDVDPNRVEMVWYTNMIPDVYSALVDPQNLKGANVKATLFWMGGNSLMGHICEWPVGHYHKAHHHAGGDILLILRSRGYSLMWPKEAGVHPFESGNEDAVIRVDWREGSVFSPPTGWFHTHFNTGHDPALYIAFRYSASGIHPTEFHAAHIPMVGDTPGVYVSYRDGGTLIEYEDEDPQIRLDYEEEVRKTGIVSRMPVWQYNKDVLDFIKRNTTKKK